LIQGVANDDSISASSKRRVGMSGHLVVNDRRCYSRPKLARMDASRIAFVGGGNMASAIIGGLLRAGRQPLSLVVVEPDVDARDRLAAQHRVHTIAAADQTLAACALIVWAVKPQVFVEAVRPVAPHVRAALQLSIMAGIRSDAIAAATGSERVVRAMPNTPALIGEGVAGLYARPAVTGADRRDAEGVLAPTGALLWVDHESDLDAVTALSGSGPAYVFYIVEAMMQAAVEMGLTREQGRQLALATLAGSTALARQTNEEPDALRARVTSEGGTTHAAITSLEAAGVKQAFVAAIRAAAERARELGDQFGR
jgi:pyrroline-5-carboxylate reductase